MQVYYNSKYNFFRTPELWDIELVLYLQFPKKEMFFNWMDIIKRELQTGAYFVFDVSHEPRIIPAILKNNPYSSDPIFLDWILEYGKLNKLDSSAIQIWTGDLNCYDNIDKKYHNIMKPKIRFNHLPIFSTDRNFINERTFDKKFSIMLGRLAFKPERLQIYHFLKENKILDDCFYCFNTIKSDENYPVKFLETTEERNSPDYDLPRFGEKYFKKSFLHIVVESFFSNKSRLNRKFVSEKVFRATNALQPFLIISTPNYLKEFKELGFKTFDKWWDESYDEIEDNNKRLDAILKIISDLSKLSLDELKKMYLEMIPILEHNYDNVFKVNELEKYHLPIDGVFNEIGGLEYIYEDMCLKPPIGVDNMPKIYNVRKNKK